MSPNIEQKLNKITKKAIKYHSRIKADIHDLEKRLSTLEKK